MRMQIIAIVGVLLIAMGIGIAIGVGAVTYLGVTDRTTTERIESHPREIIPVARTSSLEATCSGLALASGIALVIAADRKS